MFDLPFLSTKRAILALSFYDSPLVGDIFSIKKKDIKKIIKNNSSITPALMEMHLKTLITKKVMSVEYWTEKSYNQLRRTIKRLDITLSDKDRHDLFIIEERTFSINRSIKKIAVNEHLEHKEEVGAKFLNCSIFVCQNNSFDWIDKGTVLFSNKNIIYIGEKETFRIPIHLITLFEEKQDGLLITSKERDPTLFRIHDGETIANTFMNIIDRKVKNDLNKKYKNYKLWQNNN